MKRFFCILFMLVAATVSAQNNTFTPQLDGAYQDALSLSFQDILSERGEFFFRVHLLDLDQDDALDSWSTMVYAMPKGYTDTLRCRFDGYIKYAEDFQRYAVQFDGGPIYYTIDDIVGLGQAEMYLKVLTEMVTLDCLEAFGDDFTNIRGEWFIPRPFFEKSQYDGEDYIERVLERLKNYGLKKGNNN